MPSAYSETTLAHPSKRVNILLGVRNGAQFLTEQMTSFLAQDYVNWVIWASDDGSTDTSIQILQKFQRELGPDRLHILDGPKQGFAANFLSLINNPDMRGDYFAFADQDDIWEASKLSRAVLQLEKMSMVKPLLYCSRSRTVSADNQELGCSPLYTKAPNFQNALVQNIAAGNTMVFNAQARRDITAVTQHFAVVYHDWWVYIVVTALGGDVYYDDYLSLRYRQHGNNQIGANTGWLSKLFRIKLMLQGRFKGWNATHVTAIEKFSSRLSPESKKCFDHFREARTQKLFPRVAGILKSGVYRQTFLGNLGLLAATLLNRI
jgi:glycosyltransferase involved in cell wall biosynthesis